MLQYFVMALLLVMLILFAASKLRYDLVALLGLSAVTLAGAIDPTEAFAGFGHPAVITVAAVLIISRGLLNSGLVDRIVGLVSWVGDNVLAQIAVLTILVAVCSAFINNVGALALFMPIALRLSASSKTPASLLLMPLAFGSLLGGLTTLIGTPPNIIIANFRAETGAEAFRMFDFAPVGGLIAVAGLLFIIFLGWRLVPIRRGSQSPDEIFDIGEYLTELRVPEGSELDGESMESIENEDQEVAVVAIIRDDRRFPTPSRQYSLREGDILIVRADTDGLTYLTEEIGLELAEDSHPDRESLGSDDVNLMEVVVAPGSRAEGRTAKQLNLRRRHAVNLLGISREGSNLGGRLGGTHLRPGDVLLLQGGEDVLADIVSELGFLPLAGRGLRLGGQRHLLLAGGIFAAALAVAALGIIPAEVALVTAALIMVLARLLSPKEIYESVDWPIIVLLGAMIPVSTALENTGGSALIADGLLGLSSGAPAWITVTIILVGTMFLSDLVNNAAATVLVAPIALQVATGIGASPDPFLMAVAIGASCAFLTPIGHQSNTLVMGPGGYRFGDYWRMGLPLEAIIALIGIPALLWIWPPGI
ncbi:MAG: SLC13 family permease [Bacillota bacterium]